MRPISEGGGKLTQTPETFGAVNLGNLDADPVDANVGDTYYNTVDNVLKCYYFDGSGYLWQTVGFNISINKTQVVGTAVTLADTGTITSGMIGNTQVTQSKIATGAINDSKVATNAAIDPTKIAGTAITTTSGTIAPTQVTDTAVTLVNLRDRQYQPTNGIDVPDRAVTIGVGTATNGRLRLTFFVPTRTLTVSKFSAVCVTGGTDSGGTTVRKFGLYTVSSDGTTVTCVARSANNTSLATGAGLINEVAFTSGDSGFNSSYQLVAGTRYAVGWLFYNTGGTFNGPNMSGFTIGGSSVVGGDVNGLKPMLYGQVSNQTDITTSTLTIESSGHGAFVRLT